MSDLIGQTIGRYHIVETVGTGGMAIVYKAIDTRLERTVALKVIRGEKLGETDFLERFDREARALARLNHPNIVHINEYGELNGLPFLEMDYVPGGTLEDHLGYLIPWAEAARFLAPVAFALDHAHQQGIIHRDIKPSNILISNNGEPLITDFGIAKIMEPDRATLVTLPGFGVGTPAYMSPEQVMGKEVDGRSDVYSLGVVLYEMFTGHPPFRAETAMAVAVKQVHEQVPRPRRDLIPMPAAAEKAVMTALAKEPGDRYENMCAFAETLDKLGSKAAASASKATFTAIPIPKELLDPVPSENRKRQSRKSLPLPQFFSQNRVLTILLSVVVVAVVATMVFSVGYAQRLIIEQRTRLSASDSGIPGQKVSESVPGRHGQPISTDQDASLGAPAGLGASAYVASDTPTPSPTPSATGSPTWIATRPTGFSPGFGLTATSHATGISGNPTATGIPSGVPTSLSPTNGPTQVPPTPIPPTSAPPTIAPTTVPATPVPTPAEPVPTKTPKPDNTHKPPTKTP